jgi:hypothetical protein
MILGKELRLGVKQVKYVFSALLLVAQEINIDY